MLSNLQRKTLKYIIESYYLSFKYVDYMQYIPDEKCKFTAHICSCLTDEWIKDLVARYDASEFN